jgi:CCR4-NOT transcription complex subunit 1
VETDDGVIFRAAHLMVGTLAGSLAHVTCKVLQTLILLS